MDAIRFFDEAGLTLDEVGGKAVNLARMTTAGFPVPPGFVVTTEAFRAAIDRLGLRPTIDATLATADAADPASVDDASIRIRSAFSAADVPEPIATAVLQAYRKLGAGPVAVRSSATAEDLPDFSFAGQQDTLLGVTGEDALLRAVLECWSSLWTARAITYRRRAGIPDEAAALAVAVQRMVPADVSGVLFTANPLTGHRGQMAIDATFGLGEALVSGLVEPDHYVADAQTGRVLRRALGAKAVVTTSADGGGVETRKDDRGHESALSDQEVASLVELGRRVQAEYGAPQDIEWAIVGGEVALLQTRAITSLYPVPPGVPPDSVWLSFGAVQGVLTPITPLGADAIRSILSGAARVFGATLQPENNPYLRPAGERLWIRLDLLLRNPLGRRAVPGLLASIDPSARQIGQSLAKEGLLPPLRASSLRPLLPRLARFVRAAGRNLPRAIRDPQGLRTAFDEATEGVVASTRSAFEATAAEPDPLRRAAVRARTLRLSITSAFPVLVPYAGVVIAAPVLGLRVITRLAAAADGGDHGVSPVVLEVTRALPHNVTTEMDLALWRVAASVRADSAASLLFADLSAAELVNRYASGRLPHDVTEAVDAFLEAYGMRGIGEIDMGRPRWRDDPTGVFATLQRYQDIPAGQSPPAQFARGEEAALRASEELVRRAGSTRGGAIRSRVVRLLTSRVRTLAGGRELPKFTIVRMLGIAREALLDSARDLVDAGLLAAPEDVFLLRLHEIEHIDREDAADLRARVEERRQTQAREWRRVQVPRVLVGDGRAFYEGLGQLDGKDGAIMGSPVSPGTVEGLVRVVLDPSRAELRQGEILVCPGTDPAWTPLFLTAGGLVTEVGGMMTHGSVVAREYGIPAVVGVHEATMRLKTGQRIRLDGTAGTIVIVDEASTADDAQELAAAPA